MKNFPSLPLLLALSLAFSLAPAVRAADDPLAELDGYLARQHGENAQCNKFRKKWHGAVKGGLTRESASHVSKAQALDMLKLLEKFPFRGSAQAKAWVYFVEHQEALAQVPDQKAVVERLGRIEPQCEMFSRAVHRELLVKDVSALSFSKKEKRGVERLVRSFLADDATSSTLPGLGVKLNLLNTYLEKAYDGANREALQPKAAALLKELDDGREAVKPEMKQLSEAGKGETIAYWAPELRLWAAVNAKLKALLGELEDGSRRFDAP